MFVTELLNAMPQWEFEGWRQYYLRNGFAVDRQVGVAARSASAICGSWGSRISPAELIPRAGTAKRTAKAMLSYVSSIPGAQVYRYGR